MAAGNLRHRVILEAPGGAADGAGGVDLVWNEIATLWVEIRAVSGAEQLAFGRASASLASRIILRYRSDVATDMRFRLGSRVFEIRRVGDPDGTKRWLECMCEERVQ